MQSHVVSSMLGRRTRTSHENFGVEARVSEEIALKHHLPSRRVVLCGEKTNPNSRQGQRMIMFYPYDETAECFIVGSMRGLPNSDLKEVEDRGEYQSNLERMNSHVLYAPSGIIDGDREELVPVVFEEDAAGKLIPKKVSCAHLFIPQRMTVHNALASLQVAHSDRRGIRFRTVARRVQQPVKRKPSREAQKVTAQHNAMEREQLSNFAECGFVCPGDLIAAMDKWDFMSKDSKADVIARMGVHCDQEDIIMVLEKVFGECLAAELPDEEFDSVMEKCRCAMKRVRRLFALRDVAISSPMCP